MATVKELAEVEIPRINERIESVEKQSNLISSSHHELEKKVHDLVGILDKMEEGIRSLGIVIESILEADESAARVETKVVFCENPNVLQSTISKYTYELGYRLIQVIPLGTSGRSFLAHFEGVSS